MSCTKNHYIEYQEDTSAPTLFRNPAFARPFELLTRIYSTPRYGGFDPTLILAISFPLFFGIMLTDVVYGMLLFLIGIIVRAYAKGRGEDGIRQFGGILAAIGAVTTLMGFVFGSYFGDFFQRLGYNVPMLLDPMKDIVVILTITLVMGMVHMATGLISGFIDNIRTGNAGKAVSEQLVWILFITGIVTAILAKGTLVGLWGGIFALAVILRLVTRFMDGGSIIAVLSLSDFMGFIGDNFSYSRIMALAIGTSGIALAVNFLASMCNDMIPYIGVVFGVIVFIIGHLFNFLMNGLGSFVHSMRLHYLEFFSKFYEGGGRVYEPFCAIRKITSLEVRKW